MLEKMNWPLDLASWNGSKRKKGVIGDSKYRQFLKVVFALKGSWEIAGRRAWCSFFSFFLFFSSFVLRWEKSHQVCVLMDYPVKREKRMMQRESCRIAAVVSLSRQEGTEPNSLTEGWGCLEWSTDRCFIQQEQKQACGLRRQVVGDVVVEVLCWLFPFPLRNRNHLPKIGMGVEVLRSELVMYECGRWMDQRHDSVTAGEQKVSTSI